MSPRNFTTAGAMIYLMLSLMCVSAISRAGETNGGSTPTSSNDPKASPVLAGKLDSNNCELTIKRMVNGALVQVPVEPPPAKMQIYQDDQLSSAGPNGCDTKITLGDGTSFGLHGVAKMTLDKYVYAGPRGHGDVALSYVTGLVRWLTTGNQDPDSYKISTPVATIGVRGTAFTVSTENAGKENEQENIVVTSGSVFVTSKMTARLSIVKAGQKVRITAADGKVSKPAFVKL
jgi:hypothetical protein